MMKNKEINRSHLDRNKTGLRAKTFNSETEARELMRLRNRHGVDGLLWVQVEGPEEGQHTVMAQVDAIDGGFGYTWSAGR